MKMANPSESDTAPAREKALPGKPRALAFAGVVLLACALLAPPGCGGNEAPPPPPAAAQRRAKANKAKKKPVVVAQATEATEVEEKEEQRSGFNYQPQVLRDPFQPYVELIEEEGTKGPLEYYDLEEIEVLGIISGIRDSRAKVKAGGDYYTIRRGTPIGKNHGRVIAIRGAEIVIRERFRDEVTRGYKFQESVLKMAR